MKIFRFFPLIGIALFIAIIYFADPQKILSVFLSANLIFILIAFLFFFPIIFLQSFKWALLLKSQSIDLDFGFLTKIFLISSFYAAVTPGKLGTFVRIPYIKKKTGKPLSECAISVLMDRLMDIFSLVFLTVVGFMVFPILTDFSQFLNEILAVFFLGLIVVLAIFKKNYSFSVDFLFRFFLPKKFKDTSRVIPITKEKFKLRNRYFFSVLFLSLLAQFMTFIQGYLIAISFGIFIPLHFFIPIVAFSSIITLIPISIQGLGTREAVLVYFFSLFSVEPSKTVVFSLSTFVLLYVFVIIFGGYFSLKEKL